MDKLPKIGEQISGWERVGWLRVDVGQAYITPWGYGVAYWRWDCDKVVCYPTPINWLVWIFREIYLYLVSTPYGIEHRSYRMGYADGLEMRQRLEEKIDD
jgi:hypothetical protein